LTGGEAHDCPLAERLIRRAKPSKRLLGDKAYDSAELRGELHERGTKPVIPNRCNRIQPFSFSKRLYKLRWRIESAFNRLKDFRRIATRYDKAGTKLPGLYLPRRRSRMVDLMSLDPSFISSASFSSRFAMSIHTTSLCLDQSLYIRVLVAIGQ
jgi:transposase